MDPNPEEFHKSINKELKVIQNRVRSLIGDANWGEDGRYKEAVLRSTIKRFLPENMSLGTGFIVQKKDNEMQISKQIDIIIYDNTYPVLFSEGDFLITTPANVKGIVEVKTNLVSSQVEEVISKATRNGKLLEDDAYNGVFVYNRGGLISREVLNNCLQGALVESKGIVDHICLGENIFIKFWDQGEQGNSNSLYRVYEIKGLSFSYFISNLAESVSGERMKERWWFLYPIPKGKEDYQIHDIVV